MGNDCVLGCLTQGGWLKISMESTELYQFPFSWASLASVEELNKETSGPVLCPGSFTGTEEESCLPFICDLCLGQCRGAGGRRGGGPRGPAWQGLAHLEAVVEHRPCLTSVTFSYHLSFSSSSVFLPFSSHRHCFLFKCPPGLTLFSWVLLEYFPHLWIPLPSWSCPTNFFWPQDFISSWTRKVT